MNWANRTRKKSLINRPCQFACALLLSLATSLFLIQHVKIPSRWFTYQFLPSRGRELSAAVWTQLIHTLISSFHTYGRCLFFFWNSRWILYVICELASLFHSSTSTDFHRISQHSRDSFFAGENNQLFNFQEVVYLSMVSWHYLISPRHKSYIQKRLFFITRSWRMFLQWKNCWFVFTQFSLEFEQLPSIKHL